MCVKCSQSLKLSVCVVLLLRPHSGPRNFIYQETDRAPRRALFRKTHTLTINNWGSSGKSCSLVDGGGGKKKKKEVRKVEKGNMLVWEHETERKYEPSARKVA